MQLRLLLVLCLFAIIFTQTDANLLEHKWVDVFKSFFKSDDQVVSVKDSSLDDQYARVKRSIYASMGAQVNCEPGFTGKFCETPICTNRVPPSDIDDIQYRKIDQFFLRQGCAGNITFPLDSESQHLTIQVAVNEGNINLTLTDDQGIVVPPNLAVGGIFAWNQPHPGIYQLNVRTDSLNTIYCDVTVETETNLEADVGFVDRPHEDAFEKGIAYNTPQYVIVHPYFLNGSATIKAVYIYENNRDHTRFVSRLQPRFGCGYEYYAGEFKCDPTMTSYRWVVEGIDYKGYLWRRSNSFACA
uniref:MD domain-containing protein n=1 Tax=Acrobeloides nanus TaxID=290746 RepID=A0A914CD69_9BILA